MRDKWSTSAVVAESMRLPEHREDRIAEPLPFNFQPQG
jgi:hypothetical protein